LVLGIFKTTFYVAHFLICGINPWISECFHLIELILVFTYARQNFCFDVFFTYNFWFWTTFC